MILEAIHIFSYNQSVTLVGISATILFHTYYYRYRYMHQMCVWYAQCKRKYYANKKQNVPQLTLSYIDDACAEENHFDSSDNVKKTLFPHIKEIYATDAENKQVNISTTFAKSIHNWILVYNNHSKKESTIPVKQICLHDELKRQYDGVDSVPHKITIKLDTVLLQLLKIQVPVNTIDGMYTLMEDVTHNITLHG